MKALPVILVLWILTTLGECSDSANRRIIRSVLHLKNESPPKFEETFEDISADIGTDVEILCEATGSPKPVFTWIDQKGDEIKEEEGSLSIRRTDNGTTLHIKNVQFEHGGMYTCSAKNADGMVTKVHRLTVYNRTVDDNNVVSSVKVVEIAESSVTFQVVAKNEESQSSDIGVRYEESREKGQQEAVFKAGDKQKVENLIVAGKYEFQFRVQPNGRWSEKFSVTLLPGIPDVVFRAIGSGTLHITVWRPVDDIMRGTVDKHRLSYNYIQMVSGNSFNASSCVMIMDFPTCGGAEFQVAGIRTLTYYEVRVQAHTEAGFGEPFKYKLFLR